MATLDLSTLVAWARRTGGDVLRPTVSHFIGDGSTNTFILPESGYISGVVATVDAVAAAPTVSGSVLTFSTAPVDGAEIMVAYSHAANTDLETIQWLEDATRAVSGDLNADWSLDLGSHVVTSVADTFTHELQNLIVLMAVVMSIQAKAIIGASSGIMIQDGDTKLDQSRMSDQIAKRVAALLDRYQSTLAQALKRRFTGTHIMGCGTGGCGCPS